MKLTFMGAAKMVTGSCFKLDTNGKQLLVDCGLKQGRDDDDNSSFQFSPSQLSAVIVTHSHIDHSGRLPLLKKMGFRGQVFATRLTCELLSIMLRDSAHIHEMEAQWKNQKGKRSGNVFEEPLYTMADAEALLEHLVPLEYGETKEVVSGVMLRFADAGHLLGSASAEIWITEGNETRKIAFSGDIGNLNQPIVRDPQYINSADYVVMESTYGDRNHEAPKSYIRDLAELLNSTFAAGGNVIIPSFAVGRTQELLYFIREIKERGLVSAFPHFPVYVDSPLANEATRIYSGDLRGYIDDDAVNIIENGGEMFRFENLRLSQTTDESKALNDDRLPKVIISASGMCDAGRIRHHLKHNLWRSECTVVFVGFQAIGTLGRSLIDGAKKVKLFGEEIVVNSRIVNLKGLSAHADQKGLLSWVGVFSPPPKHVFLVHGEAEASECFAALLRNQSISAHVPDLEEAYDLLTGMLVTYGKTPERSAKSAGKKSSQVYERLVNAGKELMDVIARNKGSANKDLAKFTSQIKSLIEKWE